MCCRFASCQVASKVDAHAEGIANFNIATLASAAVLPHGHLQGHAFHKYIYVGRRPIVFSCYVGVAYKIMRTCYKFQCLHWPPVHSWQSPTSMFDVFHCTPCLIIRQPCLLTCKYIGVVGIAE